MRIGAGGGHASLKPPPHCPPPPATYSKSKSYKTTCFRQARSTFIDEVSLFFLFKEQSHKTSRNSSKSIFPDHSFPAALRCGLPPGGGGSRRGRSGTAQRFFAPPLNCRRSSLRRHIIRNRRSVVVLIPWHMKPRQMRHKPLLCCSGGQVALPVSACDVAGNEVTRRSACRARSPDPNLFPGRGVRARARARVCACMRVFLPLTPFFFFFGSNTFFCKCTS